MARAGASHPLGVERGRTDEYPSKMSGRRLTPLVLLHGAGQSPTSWEALTRQLGARPIMTPWIPGLRPTDGQSPDYLEAAASLEADLARQVGGPVDICGLSYGAVVATQLAAAYPHRVRRLVLIAGQVRPPRLLMRLQLFVLRMIPASRFVSSGVSKASLLRVLAAMTELDLTAALPLITAPTLVLVGGKDRPNLPAARALSRGIADAQLRIVDHAGHTVNEDQPTELAALLVDFLG